MVLTLLRDPELGIVCILQNITQVAIIASWLGFQIGTISSVLFLSFKSLGEHDSAISYVKTHSIRRVVSFDTHHDMV